MAFEHKAGTATLFRNDKKTAGDNLPDYKGEGKDMAGNPFEIAGWIKEGKDGSKFLSIKISAPFSPSGPTTPAPGNSRQPDNARPVAVPDGFPIVDLTDYDPDKLPF